MLSSKIGPFLIICFIRGYLEVNGLADQLQEESDSGNQTATNNASENDSISSNNTDTHLPEDDHETDEGHNSTENYPITMEHQSESRREDELHHTNKSLRAEPHEIANITSYMQNLSTQAVGELRAIWCNQTYIRILDEEENVIYQTHKVQLKRVRYFIDRAEVLTTKQCKSIASLDWNEKDEEQPKPYHDDVIGQLAKYWDEMERYFQENKLRGVDVSIRRITKSIEKAKEELNTTWDRLKELVVEIDRLKSLLQG